MKEHTHTTCPLCENKAGFNIFPGQDSRTYRHCPECRLVFVDPQDLLAEEDETSRYLSHNNGIEYPGYVKFLNRAISPTLPYLEPGAKGLDFGCGPVPTLSLLMQQKGFDCDDYDPIFVPDQPTGPYDYIFATECVEHFYNPKQEFSRLSSLLKQDGILTIMTLFWQDKQDFSSNFYFRDITHCVFYHPLTIEWIARQYGFAVEYTDAQRLVVLRKIACIQPQT